MGIILWIVLGLIAGWVASAVMKSSSSSAGRDIILGIIGALLGGFIMNLLGQPGITGFNVYSILVAILGAIVLIWLGRALQRA